MRILVFVVISVLIAGALDLHAQKPGKKFTVSGTVTDANNNPVSGAYILLNNKNTDVTTDSKGFYKIKVKPSDTLITAFIMNGGLKEERINGRTTIDFKLSGVVSQAAPKPAVNKEDEQEYNIGYGTLKKREMTTTVGKIDGTNKKYASYTNIYDMIKGEVPGVHVAGKRITIQGPSSLNLSTEPLILVNGIETTNLDDISPLQVKSIEVLKGAAASIYGSRGANGVILITLVGSDGK
ncbi:MAG TPA: TonB-dependent receptor plug domain-containing protein [Bacteroidales bacterium]|nr:TonB-dependent receptor plug domain-containing protein [Bacteroidales bacterium]